MSPVDGSGLGGKAGRSGQAAGRAGWRSCHLISVLSSSPVLGGALTLKKKKKDYIFYDFMYLNLWKSIVVEGDGLLAAPGVGTGRRSALRGFTAGLRQWFHGCRCTCRRVKSCPAEACSLSHVHVDQIV